MVPTCGSIHFRSTSVLPRPAEKTAAGCLWTADNPLPQLFRHLHTYLRTTTPTSFVFNYWFRFLALFLSLHRRPPFTIIVFVLRVPLVVALSKVFFCRTRSIRRNRFEFLTTPKWRKMTQFQNPKGSAQE